MSEVLKANSGMFIWSHALSNDSLVTELLSPVIMESLRTQLAASVWKTPLNCLQNCN